MAGTWTSDGSNTRTISVPKTAQNNYVYGDDEHGTSSSSERSFACLKNNTEFEHTFEFETPEWITSPQAVSHANGANNYYNLKFNIAANSGSERRGNIVIKCNEKTLTLTVIQAGETASFKIYMNSSESFSNLFKAIRINGSSLITPSGSTKSQEIFASTNPPSSSPTPVNVELQPLNNKSITLSYCKGTTHNTNNVGYTNSTIDSAYNSNTFLNTNIQNLQYANNLVTFKTSNNNEIWAYTTSDISTNIKLNGFESYPTINIYISNTLIQAITEFALFIVNESPGGNRHFGTYFTLSRDITPQEVNFPTNPPYVKIADRMDKANIHIDMKYLAGNEETLRQAFGDQDLSDSYFFYIAPVGTDVIDTTRTEQQLTILPSSQFSGLNLVAYQSNSLQLNINNGGLIPVFTSGAAFSGDTIHVYDTETIQIYCSCDYYGLPSETQFTISYAGSGN